MLEPGPVRRSLDALLTQLPHLEVVRVEWQESGPWVLVTLGQLGEGGGWPAPEAWARWEYAIWKTTGAVHSVGAGGAVSDDPIPLVKKTASERIREARDARGS